MRRLQQVRAGIRASARADVAPYASLWTLVYVTALLVLVSAVLSLPVRARGAPDGFADLVEDLLPAVVNIQVTQKAQASSGQAPAMPQVPPGSPFEEFFKDFFERQQEGRRARPVTSVGSGFIIDADGLVVTNNHVVDGADEITVILNDGTRLDAELVGADKKVDIAVVRIKPDHKLPSVGWGDSDTGRVGDWVVAIGNPLGLGGTVTAGIISARGRDIRAGPYDDFIQTDAPINKGNSGGPLFNLDGKVIGINTAIFSQSGGSIGIGFSVPANLAKPVVDQLIEFGHTKRGWLGVRIQTVTDEIAEGLGLADATGALVAGVTEGGPAEAAKIEAGDVILSFDDKPVDEMRQLPRIVAETPVGKEVDVNVWRKGEKMTFKVTLGELEKAEEVASLTPGKAETPTKEREVTSLGLKLSAVTAELRERFQLGDDVNGVVVTEVETDSVADEKGIRAGDMIVEVSQEEVKTPSEVVDKVQQVEESNRKSVLLLLRRAGDLLFVAVRLQQS